jgi:hypothetical protein
MPTHISAPGGIIAPNVVVNGDAITVVFGSTDSNMRASIYQVSVTGPDGGLTPTSEAQLLGGYPRRLSFARDGILPTDALSSGKGEMRIFFSGFHRTSSGIRLRGGVARGNGRLVDFSLGQDLFAREVRVGTRVCASASLSRLEDGLVWFARGRGFAETASGKHPRSSIWCGRVDRGKVRKAVEVLRPREGQYALTRPFHTVLPNNQEVLFLSLRTHRDTYEQAAYSVALKDYVSIRLREHPGEPRRFLYLAPFSYRGRLYCALNHDHLGQGGISFCSVDVEEREE